MLRKAAEGLHHTPAQVEQAVAEAVRIVEANGMEPPDVQHLVAAVTGHLLSKQVMFEQVTASGVLLAPNGGQ